MNNINKIFKNGIIAKKNFNKIYMLAPNDFID